MLMPNVPYYSTKDFEEDTFEKLIQKSAAYYAKNGYKEAKHITLHTAIGETELSPSEVASFNEKVLSMMLEITGDDWW